jgi:hypothetical protein
MTAARPRPDVSCRRDDRHSHAQAPAHRRGAGVTEEIR